jgi:hypothetical protein
MSDTSMMVLGLLEVAGLLGLFVLYRSNTRRRQAGKGRRAPVVRILIALLVLTVLIGFPAVMIVSIMNPSLQNERRHERLVRNGTPATATITQVRETGTVINRRPEVQVWLRVQPKDGPVFSSRATWVFSVSDLQTYRVGTEVNVFFDPDDPETATVTGVAPPRS